MRKNLTEGKNLTEAQQQPWDEAADAGRQSALTMNARTIRRDLAEAEVRLASLRASLARAITACGRTWGHTWGEAVHDPIVHPMHKKALFPGSTLQVDVAEQRIDRWRRTCTRCGHAEETQRTTPGPTTPIFDGDPHASTPPR